MTTRWAPVDIRLLLDFYTLPVIPFSESSGEVAGRLAGAGLIRPKGDDAWELTPSGLAFIAFLLDMPTPEQQWHMPFIPHKTSGFFPRD